MIMISPKSWKQSERCDKTVYERNKIKDILTNFIDIFNQLKLDIL